LIDFSNAISWEFSDLESDFSFTNGSKMSPEPQPHILTSDA